MIATITPQSISMGEGTNYAIIGARGFESPMVEVAKHPLAGRHGITVHRTFWRERIIRLEFALRANTISDYATLRKNFMEAWDLPRSGNTIIPFTTTDGKSLQLTANISNVIEGGFEPGNITVGRIRVEIICGDPNLFGQTLNEETLSPPVAGGVTLPTVIPFALSTSGGSMTITNNGNGISYPTIRISGPATNAHVRNSTLGVQFNITNPLTAAQYVDIDPWEQTVLLNGTTNWIQYFDGSWWWLEPGSNSVQFNSDDNDPAASVRLQWRHAYLGI